VLGERLRADDMRHIFFLRETVTGAESPSCARSTTRGEAVEAGSQEKKAGEEGRAGRPSVGYAAGSLNPA